MSTTDLPPAYDSIKELGAYDSLPDDVKGKMLTLVDLPQSVQDAAHAAMAEKAAKPETTTKLMEEVKALADSAIKVDEAFERVRIGLGKVDDNDYTDKKGNPIAKFQPTWVGFQKRWTTLLWGSRDVATETEAYINDFVTVIVPIVEAIKTPEDLANARLDLGAFIKRKDPFGKQLNSTETKDLAQKYSQDFTDLRRQLEEFKGTFDSFAHDREVKLGDDIIAKNNSIKTLQLEIAACQTVVMAMGIALGVTVFATLAGAVGALAAFGPAGPFVAIGIIVFGAIAAISELGVLIAYMVKTDEKRAELATARRQLADLEAQLEQLKALKATLQSQKADIIDICARIDRFASIWGTVAHDAGLISANLDAAVGDEGTQQAFQTRVSLIKTSYTNLGAALALYATSISHAKEPEA